MQNTGIPLADQIKEVRREIELRAKFWPRLVTAGKLAVHLSNRRQAAMQAVLETLDKVSNGELHVAGLPRSFQKGNTTL